MSRQLRIRTTSIIVTAMAAALVLKVFCFDLARVEGVSMEPGLMPGDAVFIFRAAYGLHIPFSDRYFFRWANPDSGDLVVFRNPKTGILAVKRCSVVGPSPVVVMEGSITFGLLPFKVNPSQEAYFRELGALPLGSIFVSGDNGPESVDSRDYGYIPIESLSGSVLFRL